MRQLVLASLVLLLLSIRGIAQTKAELSNLKLINANYQSCLDEGENRVACSRLYYIDVDSVMRGVYEHLKMGLKPVQQAYLVKEQQEWLQFRDRRFRLIDKHNNLEGRDREMVSYHDKANFVIERAMILIGRI
ncbi:DUF1311 domain-containing protein [Flavihumibacter sp. R14]|nr:DUF1311 domain-containing protein [Flavihumibacter soli]